MDVATTTDGNSVQARKKRSRSRGFSASTTAHESSEAKDLNEASVSLELKCNPANITSEVVVQKVSPLLMLPGEIRNQIYRFAFRPRELDIRPPLTKTPVAGHIYAERDCYESQTLIRITPFLPALLRVNRQIRSEAYTLVFEKVILRLVEQSIARPFMGSNSFWTHTRHLQVRLFMEKETDPHFVELLIKCPKLETVLIELDYHSGWQGICYAYNFAKLAFRLTQLLEALSKLEKSRYWLGAGTTTTF